jgi:hypothetical protein
MRELTDMELDAVGGGSLSGSLSLTIPTMVTVSNVGNVHLDLANVVTTQVTNQVAVAVLSASTQIQAAAQAAVSHIHF